MDPIAELIEALERDGKPSLAWVVRWSEGGRGPLRAAWTASRDPIAMTLLLGLPVEEYRARNGPPGNFARMVRLRLPPALASLPWWMERWRDGTLRDDAYDLPQAVLDEHAEELCALIRAAVPEPPTLAELLDASAAR